MTRQPGDTASQLQELISRALRQQVRSNQRFADLLRRIASGELNSEQVRDQIRQFSETEANEYIRSLTNAGVSFFSHLLELNDNFNERFFRRFGQDGSKDEESAAQRRARIALQGALGSVVKAAFVVENRRDASSDVCLVFPKVSRSDGVAFQAPFVAEPAAFRLRPGEERPVQISLQLLPELFAVGEQYSCQVLVRGPEDMILDVDIRVEPAAEAAPEAKPKPARKRSEPARTARKAKGTKRERRPKKTEPR